MGVNNFNRRKKSDNLRDVLPTYKHRKQADIFEVFMDRDNEGRLTQKLSITEFRTFAEGSTVEILQETVNTNTEVINSLTINRSYIGIVTQSGTSTPVLSGIKHGYDTTSGVITMTRAQEGWFDLVFPFTVDLTKMAILITGLKHGPEKATTTYGLSQLNANTIRIKTETVVAGIVVSKDSVFQNSGIYIEALPM